MIFPPKMSEDQSNPTDDIRRTLDGKLDVTPDKDDSPPGIAANSLMSLETLMAIPNSDARGPVSNPEGSATVFREFLRGSRRPQHPKLTIITVIHHMFRTHLARMT